MATARTNQDGYSRPQIDKYMYSGIYFSGMGDKLNRLIKKEPLFLALNYDYNLDKVISRTV